MQRRSPATEEPSAGAGGRHSLLITAVFVLSGFAAMIYQIVWQRSLYSVFGINIESVTVVVTAFLAGLGLGSLLGGKLSRSGFYLPVLFAVAEMSVGLYGYFSLSIFRWVGRVGLSLTEIAAGFLTIVVLLPPTLLMGLTLPILVAHGVKASSSTGKTVGSLYFANTVGSAIAALASVVIIMPSLGEQGSVTFAASLNLFVGFAILARLGKRRVIA